MKSTIRPSSARDLQELRQFLARVFGTDLNAAFLDPAMMAWKYWDKRADFADPRSYVLEKDGKISAHVGIWPLSIPTSNGEIQGVQMIDWASAPETPGAGLALVQKLRLMFDFMYSVGGSEITCKLLPALGFVRYKRQWKGVQPLRPLRQIITHQTRDWKLLPRLFRNTLWSVRRNTVVGEFKAAEISPRDIVTSTYAAGSEPFRFSSRSPAFFEHLLRCPTVPFKIYGILQESRLKGHFVLSLVRGQARLGGVWLLDQDENTWLGAYMLARQTALRMDGAYELVVSGSDGPSRRPALNAGFHVVQGADVFLWERISLPLSPDYQFQMIDDDACFLDAGAPRYWS